MNNKTMATVNGKPITIQQITGFIQSMGQQGAQYDNPQGHKLILEQLVSQELLFLDATKNGLAFDADYKAQLELAKKDLLTSYSVSKLLSKVVATEAQCKELYIKDPSKFAGQASVNASHILIDSEDKANEILEKINNDELSFEDAAKDFSSCPSKDKGGNLGEFTRGQMVKEFEDVAFVLELDTLSAPVQTQFGYHIIKVLSKSDATPRSFEEVQDQIMQQLTSQMRQQALEAKVNQLKILYPVDMQSDKPSIIV